MSVDQEKRTQAAEGLAGLFWVGLKIIGARKAARMASLSWGALVKAVVWISGSASGAAALGAILLSMQPLLVGLFALMYEWPADPTRALWTTGLGVASWAVGWVAARVCARAGRKSAPPEPEDPVQQGKLRPIRWGWLREQDQALGGAVGFVCVGLGNAAQAAQAAQSKPRALARLAGWALVTPPLMGLLALGVFPWGALRVADHVIAVAIEAWRSWNSPSLCSMISNPALGMPASVSSPAIKRKGWLEALSGRGRAIKAWASAKAMEVVKEGAGTPEATRAQRAALEKEIRPAAPGARDRRL